MVKFDCLNVQFLVHYHMIYKHFYIQLFLNYLDKKIHHMDILFDIYNTNSYLLLKYVLVYPYFSL